MPHVFLGMNFTKLMKFSIEIHEFHEIGANFFFAPTVN